MRAPGWQSSAVQMASSVVNRIAPASPVFKFLRLTTGIARVLGELGQAHLGSGQHDIEVDEDRYGLRL